MAGELSADSLQEEQFLNSLNQQILLCKSRRHPCSLLVMGPDRNPALAATARQGDATQSLLQSLIDRLQFYLGDADLFACLDRRQYAVLLPGKMLPQAYELAEGIRVKVQDTPFPANAKRPSPCSLTVSIGVAEWSADLSAHELLDLARNAHEEARSNGNMVWSSAD